MAKLLNCCVIGIVLKQFNHLTIPPLYINTTKALIQVSRLPRLPHLSGPAILLLQGVYTNKLVLLVLHFIVGALRPSLFFRLLLRRSRWNGAPFGSPGIICFGFH